MWLAVAGVWAAAVFALYEIIFPIPVSQALHGLAESGRAILPLFSLRGCEEAISDIPGNMWGISAFLILQLSSLAFGRRGKYWLDGKADPGPFSDIISLLLGWLLVGLTLMGLGLMGLFRFFPLALVALLPFAADCRGFFRIRFFLREPRGHDGILGFFGRWIVYLVLLPAALSLLAPATGQENLARSLAIPARWADLGKLVPQAGNFMQHLPGLPQVLVGWGLVLGGETSARLFPLGALLAVAGQLAGLARRFAPAFSGWAVLALFGTVSLFWELVRNGEPGIFAVPYALALGFRVFAGMKDDPRDSRGAVWAGLMAGGVVGCQLPSLAVALPVPVLFLLAGGGKARLGSLFFLFLGAAAGAGPWLLKNFFLTGDPVYPFGRAAFGIPDAALQLHSKEAWADSTRVGLAGMARIWLAALPLILIAGKPARSWWSGGALAAALGFLLYPQNDIVIPAVVWLTAAAVISVGDLIVGSGKAPVGLIWLAGAALFFQAIRGALDTAISQGLPAGLGCESRKAYFARIHPALADALEELDSVAPLNSRVLVIGDQRGYPRTRDFLVSSPYEAPAPYELIRASSTSRELADRMKQLGVSYVLHNHVAEIGGRHGQSAYAWTSRDLSVWSSYWRRHARLIKSPGRIEIDEGGFHIYRLGPERRELNVAPTLPGIGGAFAPLDGLRAEGKLEEMAEQLRILEGIAGDFPEVKFFIGDFWAGQDPYKSWDYLRGADAGGLRDVSLWQDLAYQAEQRWRLEDALAYHEKIAAISPRAPGKRHRRVLLKLSRQSAKLGKLRRAEKHLRRATGLFPEDASLWAELAEVYLSQNRRIAADWAFTVAVKLDPENREYRTALGRLRRQSRSGD